MRPCTCLLVCLLALSPIAFATPTAAPPAKRVVTLKLDTKPWQGDFNAMLERRTMRVLVPYSRTLYYIDKGHERGINAELLRDLERYINKKYAKQLGKRPFTVYIIPTTRDKLLSGLEQGKGDLATGNLTVTESRLQHVDFFVAKNRKPTQELLVTGPRSPAIASLDNLAGKTIHVRPASSYHESLLLLNQRFRAAGKPPVKIERLPDELEDEDILEMLNAGLFEYAIVDDWKARIWAQVLPKIKVRDDIALRAEGYTGWAMRKKSPQLMAAIEDYYKSHVAKSGGIDARVSSYSRQRIKQISNNTNSEELKRFESTLKLFEKYGHKYGFDPLMLAAQGYQESRLDQNARSRSGAIGIMQIMPATGKGLKVGNIREIEPNIHGGTKYMSQLMTLYFPDAKFSEAVRPLFAFASYNAGPGNIAKMRKIAAQRGLDPDKWFNNVEIVVSEKIGIETTTYVRNIYKYYTAYKLILEAQEVQEAARDKIGG